MSCSAGPPSAPDAAAGVEGFAYCCVLYGDSVDYFMLLMVLARRLQLYGARFPLLVLPTADVPEEYLQAFQRAGCRVLDRAAELRGHPELFQQPEGRHRRVLTKLRVLGLTGLQKVLLIDADVLPRRNLDDLFALAPPAAKLMPSHLEWVTRAIGAGETVPPEWLVVDWSGRAARINCGVCLLAPDAGLLAEVEAEVDPARDLEVHGTLVKDVFGGPWYKSWTPEEDALTRALARRGASWTHIGCAFNFEVKSDKEYYSGSPIAAEHSATDLRDGVAAFHFTGKYKPTWQAWYVATGRSTVAEVFESIKKANEEDDPRAVEATAVAEWLEAFEELVSHARTTWDLDVLGLCGWSHRVEGPTGQ